MAFPSSSDRRAFLRWLAASPVLASAGLTAAWFEELLGAQLPILEENAVLIKSVREALNVFDFRTAAKAKLNVAHFTEFDEGVFNEETQRADREAYSRYQIRMRRLTGITKVDQSIQLYGRTWESPLYLCPVGRLRAIHPEGNLAIAPAARNKRTLEIMSGTQDLEKVNMLRGEPVWICGGRPSPETLKRLESVGTPAYVWTVDTNGGGNQIGARAVQRAGVPDLERKNDTRCNSCHDSEGRITISDSMDAVMGALGSLRGSDTSTWADLRRVRDMTKMRLILKGIVTAEDAGLALKNGVDGVMVSTHAAHEDASGRGSLDALPEVVAAIGRKMTVFLDSGIRSGADMFKALALGASAVGIGRAQAWALAAFGTEGVETVIEMLRRELQMTMAQAAAPSISRISKTMLVERRPPATTRYF
ncbi:MAG: alpha-hydroxy-acid oxidizing protein [Acidobacteria bacterium]|nr:alpha-hydroxy-acid oxidizing protein [Acidobacteriota bacterium]